VDADDAAQEAGAAGKEGERGEVMKISVKLRAAFRRYYTNRKAQHERKWNKQADIKNIASAMGRNWTRWEACAGTFWIWWKRPRIQTIHTEFNYWTGKIVARKKGKRWVIEDQ
jgi:hypothetical protein